jgi:hypothetical protein
MAYFDYSLPQTIDLSKGMEAIGDALTDVMRRKQQREQFQQQQAQQAAHEQRLYNQNAANMKLQTDIADRKERRDELEFNQKQNSYRGAQEKAARDAVVAGNPQEAERIMAGTVLYDPHTGQERARGFFRAGEARDVGPEPQGPGNAARTAALPDVAGALQAIPGFGVGVPPELAARRRGMEARQPQAPSTMPRAKSEYRADPELNPPRGGGPDAPEFFIDQIDNGVATLVDQDGATFKVKAQPQWREGRMTSGREYFGGAGDQIRQELSADDPGGRIDLAAGPTTGAVEGGPEDRIRAAMQEADIERQVPAQHAAWVNDRADAERNRPYLIGFGNEPGTKIDLATQRYATRELAARDFLGSLPPNMNDADRAAAQNAHAAILAGVDPKVAMATFQKERIGVAEREDKQQFQAQQDAQYKRTFDQAKTLKSMTPPSVIMGERRFEASQDKDQRKETRGQIDKWIKNNGLEKNGAQRATFDLADQQLRSPDGKSQMAALVAMGRAIQGDNRWSNADHQVFVEKGGVGALDRLDTTIQQLIDGSYGEETLAVSRRLNNAMREVLKQRTIRAGQEGRRLFVHNELYDPQVAESALDEALNGGYTRETAPEGAGGPKMVAPPEIKAARGRGSKIKKAKGPAGMSIEELLKALEATP